jgi:hypothetical protein
MDKYLGSGAGGDPGVVGDLANVATGMMNALNSNDPATPGTVMNRSSYAEWEPHSDTLDANRFFNSSIAMRAETMGHESARQAEYDIQGGVYTFDSATGTKGFVPGYGAANIADLAASNRYFPRDMMKMFPDAISLSLGFMRDDSR